MSKNCPLLKKMDLNVLVFFYLPITCIYLPAPKAVMVLSVSAKKITSIDVTALAILYHAHLFVNVFLLFLPQLTYWESRWWISGWVVMKTKIFTMWANYLELLRFLFDLNSFPLHFQYVRLSISLEYLNCNQLIKDWHVFCNLWSFVNRSSLNNLLLILIKMI